MQKSLQSLKLSLQNMGYARLDNGWDHDDIHSPFSRLYYITTGGAKVHHNNKVFYLRPNYMYLIPSYTYSRYQCDFYHEQYYIHFYEEIGKGLSIYNLRNFVYEIEATEVDRNYFDRLLSLNPNLGYKNDKPLGFEAHLHQAQLTNKTAKQLETNGILSILFSRFMVESGNKKDSGENAHRLKGILTYIGENLHNPIGLETLAEKYNVSADYLSRLFYKRYGIRPNRYIQGKRIERSQMLLLTTNYSIKQISEKVGFDSLSYFSKTFKKHTGKTPVVFRSEKVNV
ncbi:AraC family transcriptional regulator [Cytophaga sp. FL35]|uniref:helix-turn-helix transcriptional regulator n=1 Tax=Cytophaga sp. FL35 TaxID=1904456 RepID=UPI001653E292|nr:AraC family transcriptional regulator [Cytophaga sp. FL35]MBC6997058.1 helix-turn-helix transcriptional regulator [Cytophaga sp. FL35]